MCQDMGWPSWWVDMFPFAELVRKYMGVSKNRGKTPKMDGWFHGEPYEKWRIWGYHYFWKHPYSYVGRALVSKSWLIQISRTWKMCIFLSVTTSSKCPFFQLDEFSRNVSLFHQKPWRPWPLSPLAWLSSSTGHLVFRMAWWFSTSLRWWVDKGRGTLIFVCKSLGFMSWSCTKKTDHCHIVVDRPSGHVQTANCSILQDEHEIRLGL